ERPGVKQFTVVDFLPLVGRTIGVIALGRQRMRWRTKAEDVQQQTFVVTVIAVWDEAGLGPPAMGQTWPTIPGPIPVCPTVKRISQGSDLDLVWRVTVEIGSCRQGPRKQKRRVDGGNRALPNSATRFDIKGMVEQASVARGVGLGTLRACKQDPESLQGALGGEFPVYDSTLDDDRHSRQRHADGGDTDRSSRISLVSDQPIIRVGFAQIVQNGGELQQTEVFLGELFEIAVGDVSVGHGLLAL